MWQRIVREFCGSEVKPHAAEVDETGQAPLGRDPQNERHRLEQPSKCRKRWAARKSIRSAL
ncbi:hypothetical protein [Candidatus Flexifilum breve]|uniref:hypothetical protein n=1 Tax=Candidatus Flexifilum breve TaxID=3140694 RepID=UPI0031CC623C